MKETRRRKIVVAVGIIIIFLVCYAYSNYPKETNSNVEYTTEGVVQIVNEVTINGNTYYYFGIDTSDFIYKSSIQNSDLQPILLKEGAEVILKYTESQENGFGIGIVTKIDIKY